MKQINMRTILGGTVTVLASLWSFGQTYTFTPATATGNIGPTQAMVNTEYTGTSLDGDVTVVGGIQYWEVPTSGNYSIEAFGGQGYGPFGGRGAHIYGEFFLNAGDTLKILVGQKAGHYLNYPATTYNNQYGGGGGSFVTTTANIPYIVAGGGGGNHATSYNPLCDAQISNNGAAGSNSSTVGAGGTSGNGGQQASSADGGGGFNGNGAGIAGGVAFVNGGLGGIDEGTGGFGCGGGTSSWNNFRGGGGGGYSGGGGGNNGASCCATGGGGGSYNSGSNPTNLAGVQLGDGMVVVTALCAPTTLTADVLLLNDINDECSVNVTTPPTATNDCGIVINGVPDVTFPITTQGTTTVTWTYDDGTTVISQTQNIVIDDVTPPSPDVAQLPDSTYWCTVDALVEPTATDNCSGTVTVTNNVTLPITTAGLTVVTWTYTDAEGNTSTQTQNITLDVIDNGVNQSGAVLTASGTGYTYQWLDCDNNYDVIAGETGQTFSPSVIGNYAVQVSFNGCVDTSACYVVDFASVEAFTNEQVTVYPNPSENGIFNVKTAGKLENVTVFDAAGREVKIHKNVTTGEVNGSSLETGRYIVRITTDRGTVSKELVILK